MTYEEALAFIHGAYGMGEKHGLNNMHALLQRLGDPHHRIRAVHVAGTNGKGSVCAFIESILRHAGYSTGLYTSPFLQQYNERIQVNAQPISNEALASAASRVASVVEQLRTEGIKPTEFEIGTAIAFLHFATVNPDIVIVEVGLGGRLDPTNVIMPLVSVIAAIGLDHMQALGDTVEKIAIEKAGIIKANTPMVVSSQNQASVLDAIKAQCEEKNAPFILAEPAVGIEAGLVGEHQQYNAGTAVAAVRALAKNGFSVSDMVIAEGLRKTRWPGRLEWIPGPFPCLLDGAHNTHGAQALAAYVHTLSMDKIALVCGVLQDKDWEGMVGQFALFAKHVYTVSPDSVRALEAGRLANAFMRKGIQAEVMGSLSSALKEAALFAGATGLVVVAGSLYLVGEARTILQQKE